MVNATVIDRIRGWVLVDVYIDGVIIDGHFVISLFAAVFHCLCCNLNVIDVYSRSLMTLGLSPLFLVLSFAAISYC